MPYVRKRKVKVAEGADEGGEPRIQRTHRTSWWIEAPVYLLLFFTPLALGTVHVWSIAVMLGLSVFAYSALVLRGRKRKIEIKLFPMGVALLGGALLTLLQLIPLPAFLVRVLSPGAAELYDHVLAGTGLWGEGNWRALSLGPPGTSLELLKFLAYTLAFLTVVNYFNERRRARRLLKIAAWSGFAVALVGFFSKLFMATAIYGVHPVSTGTFFFSTFVNSNHLAGYLGLCAPVAFGLALSSRERQDRALYGFMGVIIGVGVFMSLSRGGIVAFCLGCLFLLFFGATRKARKLRRVALVQTLAAGVLVIAGYLAYDTIVSEMKTLGDVEAMRENDKIRSWEGTFPMMADHPVVGVGRGAYATVYPRYKSTTYTYTYSHAENEVLQNMVEWGPVFGVVFIGVFALVFLLSLARARQSYTMGGCLAGIFAVSLHNLVDFNLEVGGVAFTFVCVLGILTASPFSHAGGPKEFETRFRMPRILALVLAPVTILAGVLCVPYAVTLGIEKNTDKLLAAKKPTGAEPCSETPLGLAACRMLNSYPADFMAPLVIGKAYLEGKPRDLKRAAYWLSRAMYLNPSSALTHRLMGRALYLAGHHEQALGEYRLSARWDPSSLTSNAVEVLRLTGDPRAAIRATPEDAQAYLAVSRILRNLGKKPAAAKAAKLALEQDSTLLPAVQILGEMALEDQRWEEVLGFARQAREVDPLNDWAYDLQGRVHQNQKDLDKAEKAWQEGLAQVPDSTTLAYRLGEFYLGQGRFQEAEQIAGRLKNFAPSDDGSQARLNMLIGRIQEAKGLLFEARRSYRMASTLAPGVPYYLFQVGLMEERLGKLKDAELIYERLIKEHYQVKDLQARIAGLKDTAEKEKHQAMWETYVDKKEDEDEKGDEEDEDEP